MMKWMNIVAFAVLAWVLIACAPATPTPDPSALQLTLETTPSPLQRGSVIAVVKVDDPQGRPVEGAKVRITLQMRNVGGHAKVTMGGDVALELGEGRYSSEFNVEYAGLAEFTIEAGKAGLPDGFIEINREVR
jgi:hypothetical protein